MGTHQTIELLYQSWEKMKSAHDDLDKSKIKLEQAERDIEAAIFLSETSEDQEVVK